MRSMMKHLFVIMGSPPDSNAWSNGAAAEPPAAEAREPTRKAAVISARREASAPAASASRVAERSGATSTARRVGPQANLPRLRNSRSWWRYQTRDFSSMIPFVIQPITGLSLRPSSVTNTS